MILNNDNSYKKRVYFSHCMSVNSTTGRDNDSVIIKFGDSYDYPEFEFTLMRSEVPEFIKNLKDNI